MYNTTVFTQAVDFHKTLFDNSFSIMSALQDQGYHIINRAFEKNTLIPDSGKKIYSSWADFVKQNRKSCKEYVDSRFEGIKTFFEEPETKPAASSSSTKTDKK